MKLACCVWVLTLTEQETLKQMSNIGFEWIDIQPHMLQKTHRRTIAQTLNLKVSCVGASFNLPNGTSLDSPEENKRQRAIEHVRDAITHAADLGADCVYVIPHMDASSDALDRYASSVVTLADIASNYHTKLCIEHFPGRALPTARETLQFIKDIDHPNLYLLFDSGHVQMSKEGPVETIIQAGSKLGYVHFDDNDGVHDLHWSLLDGVMTKASLEATFQALDTINYSGAISLELSPGLPSPVESLVKSRDIILELLND